MKKIIQKILEDNAEQASNESQRIELEDSLNKQEFQLKQMLRDSNASPEELKNMRLDIE